MANLLFTVQEDRPTITEVYLSTDSAVLGAAFGNWGSPISGGATINNSIDTYITIYGDANAGHFTSNSHQEAAPVVTLAGATNPLAVPAGGTVTDFIIQVKIPAFSCPSGNNRALLVSKTVDTDPGVGETLVVFDNSVTSPKSISVTVGVPQIESYATDTNPNHYNTLETNITITGFNFSSASSVHIARNGFANIAATNFAVVDNTTITATIPVENRDPVIATAGDWTIRVVNTTGPSIDAITFAVVERRPEITSVVKTGGTDTFPNDVATEITITGTNFILDGNANNAGVVQLDGVALASIASWSDSLIVATVPARKNPEDYIVNIQVTIAGNDFDSWQTDTVTITQGQPLLDANGINPNNGNNTNTTPFTITGYNFLAPSVNDVTVNFTSAGHPDINVTPSSIAIDSLTATLPAFPLEAGDYTVKVTVDKDGAGGSAPVQSSGSLAFTINENRATITAVRNQADTDDLLSVVNDVATIIRLNGTRFVAGATVVKLNNVNLATTCNSTTTLTATVPSEFSGGVGDNLALDVAVTISGTSTNAIPPAATLTVTRGRPFLYTASPVSGFNNIDRVVTLTGFNFTGFVNPIVLTNGGQPQNYVGTAGVNPDTTITITVPHTATVGAHSIVVTANGPSTESVTYTVTNVKPIITSDNFGPFVNDIASPITIVGTLFNGDGANPELTRVVVNGNISIVPVVNGAGTSMDATIPAYVIAAGIYTIKVSTRYANADIIDVSGKTVELTKGRPLVSDFGINELETESGVNTKDKTLTIRGLNFTGTDRASFRKTGQTYNSTDADPKLIFVDGNGDPILGALEISDILLYLKVKNSMVAGDYDVFIRNNINESN